MGSFKYTKMASNDTPASEASSAANKPPFEFEDLESEAVLEEEKPAVEHSRRKRLLAVMPDFVHKADIRGRAYIKQFGWPAVVAAVFCMYGFALICVYMIFEWSWWHHGPAHTPALNLTELRNGTYTPGILPVNWVPTGENGLYSLVDPNGFYVRHWINSGEQDDTRKIAPRTLKVGTDEESRLIRDVVLNKQQTHVLAKTDVEKHWRHSTYARYWISKIGDDGKTEPIPLRAEKISIAQWNPDGSSIAYVFDHNVYVYNVHTAISRQVTTDGGADVFNGIPDWVYEEEVFSGDSAMWWSPSGEYLAYLRTNDSLVPKFPIPYFVSKAHDSDTMLASRMVGDESSGSSGKYPSLVELKYPKPGFPNPQVELWLYAPFGQQTPKLVEFSTELNQPIITELVWVGTNAVVKVLDREADHLEVWVIDPSNDIVTKSRSYSSKDQGGAWFEITHNTQSVGDRGYIDRIVVNGFNHLAYFSPVNASEPEILTTGEWEVLDKPIGVNKDTGDVFFHATKESSMSSLIFRVSLSEDVSKRSVEKLSSSESGVCSAAFSPDGTFLTATCENTDAPSKQYVAKSAGNTSEEVIETNNRLKELMQSRNLFDESLVQYGTLDIGDGISVNYREIRPTNFDSKRKHPLLFYNYGGPASQTVRYDCRIDYQRIFAETHNAVVVSVDPRGTAGRGREFMSGVRDHLGEYEADDVIKVAKIFNKKSYIDEDTTAIWGWSYGGFLTLKVLERDEDLAFKYGVAVAPVTDWSLYDSIYTERYMHTPEHNPEGYTNSTIHNLTNIARHNRFMIMHGTGDDNVHFQNTLKLLDRLDLEGIENYDVHVYPDSDHSISFHNANAMVFDRIDQWFSNYQKSERRHNGRL